MLNGVAGESLRKGDFVVRDPKTGLLHKMPDVPLDEYSPDHWPFTKAIAWARLLGCKAQQLESDG